MRSGGGGGDSTQTATKEKKGKEVMRKGEGPPSGYEQSGDARAGYAVGEEGREEAGVAGTDTAHSM